MEYIIPVMTTMFSNQTIASISEMVMTLQDLRRARRFEPVLLEVCNRHRAEIGLGMSGVDSDSCC